MRWPAGQRRRHSSSGWAWGHRTEKKWGWEGKTCDRQGIELPSYLCIAGIKEIVQNVRLDRHMGHFRGDPGERLGLSPGDRSHNQGLSTEEDPLIRETGRGLQRGLEMT